jgi:hypothetical protein
MTGNIERRLSGIRKRRFEFNESGVDRNLLKLDELKSQLDKISVVFHEYVSKVKEDKLKNQDSSRLLN